MSPFGRLFADGDRLEVAGAPVRLKVNRRARRVSLRLGRTPREVVATAPALLSPADKPGFSGIASAVPIETAAGAAGLPPF